MNTKSDKLKVSVIMPTHNYGAYIGEAIQSVIHQTYENWELLIIDDCSTDGTYENLTKKYFQNPNIRIFKTEKNGGTAVARNIGLNFATGDLIAFLDSDDAYDSNYLESQVDFFRDDSIDIVVSSYRRQSDRSVTNFIVPKTITFKLALCGNPMAPLGTIFRKSLYPDLRFPTDMLKCEDYVFFLNLLKKKAAIGNQKVLGTLRIHKGSKSKNKIKLIKWQYLSYKKVGVSFLKRFYYLAMWAIYGIQKYKDVK